MDQGPHVLGKAGAAVAHAGIDEMVADAPVGADAGPDFPHVGAHRLADVGHLVHEGDLGGQHAVGGVFGHLRAAGAHDDHLVPAARKGGVESLQQLGRAHVVRAHDHAVGLEEIVDRIALFQKFRVRDHIEFQRYAPGVELLLDDLLDPVGRAHRHGGLVDDDLVVGDELARSVRPPDPHS